MESKKHDSYGKVTDGMAKCRANVKAAKADTSGKIYRVYCDGVFDMFHLGHMRMLQQAKLALGEERTYLICGIHSDAVTEQNKGKTVMEDKVRYETARHCKWVDEVVEDAPWVVTKEYMDELKLDFVAHDSIPYVSSGHEDIYAQVKKEGKFLTTQRTSGISTSDIITVLLRGYDSYVRRNLERGITKKEMNVGATWALRARQHDQARKVKQRLTQQHEALTNTRKSMVGFVRQFDPRPMIWTSAYTRVGEAASEAADVKAAEEAPPGSLLAMSQGAVEVAGHGWQFVKATVSLGWDVFQLVVPVGFLLHCPCRRKKRK